MLSYPTFDIRNVLATLVLSAVMCVPLLSYYGAPSYLERIQASGELRVAMIRSPIYYHVENGQATGFEYQLTQSFADYLGVQLQVFPFNSLTEVSEALRQNNVHLAAAGLTQTPAREKRFDFGPPYLAVRTLLIQNASRKPPRSLLELEGARLRVVAGSSHAELLRRVGTASLNWEEAPEETRVQELLAQVNAGTLDYTLADDIQLQVQRAYYPRLETAFALSPPQPLAWMLKRQRDNSLNHRLESFFAHPETQTLIGELAERYLSEDQRLNLVDTLTFRRQMRERLPPLKDWFQQAAKETGLDWRLLAAVGYQESHWDPEAVSPTGVRGIMMLTRSTARQLGVKRTDPRQSILGGARYLADLKSRLPERIQDPDRTWLALAAYNIGLGHLEDARVLTQRAGGNPDLWADVRQYLPRLSNPEWYPQTRHGFARGREPVVYVRNIRQYRRQLTLEARLQASEEPRLPASAGISTLPASAAAPALESLPPTL